MNRKQFNIEYLKIVYKDMVNELRDLDKRIDYVYESIGIASKQKNKKIIVDQVKALETLKKKYDDLQLKIQKLNGKIQRSGK